MSSWRTIRSSQDQTELGQFQFQTHSLKGESGALGFNQLYGIISELDNKTREIQQDGFSVDAIAVIDQLLNQLIAANNKTPNPLLIHPDSAEVIEIAEPVAKATVTATHSSIKVALVDDEFSVGLATSKQLQSFGFEVQCFQSIVDCKQAMEDGPFTIVLLDVVMPDTSEVQVFDFARFCLSQDTRVISLSSKDDLSTRLRAVRAGVDDYALKPVNMNNLVSKIKRVCSLDVDRPYKIVLLDDQTTIGEYFKKIGEQHRFELVSFDNAAAFISNLDVSIPDLFLLDINMPDASGFEVAKILRHEARFEYVPIVFLSADDSNANKLEVLAAGGEDIISKSDSPEFIFKQIEYRVTRGQHIRSLSIKDGLTGLLNHGQLMESLDGFKRLADRMNTRFGLALLDLDDFKSVNDTYGHSIGDNVLTGLSKLLESKIRGSDIVGRYGGEEFLIAFQDVKDAATIVTKLNKIREAFSTILFQTKQGDFSRTFSCGLVMSTPGISINDLVNSADERMYTAKKLVKNQVVSD